MKKILLIDGHSIINRAYYALPVMTSPDGTPTNAIYGFLNIIFKYIDIEKPDYFAVAFDMSAPTFRHKMYPEYKGTRKKMDDELRVQVPILQELLKKMNVPLIMKEGIEADDILGTIGKRAQSDGLLVTIVSGDRDLLQLADDNIKISIPKTTRTGTETFDYMKSDVIEKMGVSPTEFIDVKALWGDTSDNIPGVPGIGEKGAFAIISKYKSIEEAYAHVDEVTPKRASTNLKEYYEQAILSKELATICINCELDFDLEQAQNSDMFTKEAYSMCEDLGLKSILKRFPDEIEKEGISENAVELKEAKDAGSAKEALETVQKLKETDVLGMAFDENEETNGFYLSVEDEIIHIDTKDFEKDILYLQNHISGKIALAGIKETLLPKISDINQLEVSVFFDIYIAMYLMDPTLSRYELSCDTSDAKQVAFYCQTKCRTLNDSLKENGMDGLFYDMEMPLSFTLYRMEKEGIYLDKDELNAYNANLTACITDFENEIYTLCNERFNINSPKQLGEVLFEKMGIPGGKKTKTGYSTAADVLEKLADEYPVVSKILLYRQYSKLKSTYAEGLMDCVGEDGRVHTTFQQTVTATGRLSSTNPNLQNIPIRTELGRMIRKVFKAKPGYIFIDADYSQIELRVLAHMSEDENLIEAYRENKDIHRATAAKVFGKDFSEVTDRERSNAKAVNFGIVYGISSFGLGQDLNISRKEAQKYIDDYYKAYPSLKQFLDNLVERAKRLGYSETMFSRRRPTPELKAKNFMQRSFGERISMNSPIQGTAADIIKIAMLRVDNRLRKEGLSSKLILQVHDELLIEAKEEEKELVRSILTEEMENAAKLRVPLIADVHEGYNWFDAK